MNPLGKIVGDRQKAFEFIHSEFKRIAIRIRQLMLGETEAIGGQIWTLWPGLPGDSAVSEVRAKLVCEERLGFRNSQ